MKIALIAKPPTGRRNRSHTVSRVVEQLAASNIHSEVFRTRYPAHALKIVKELPLNQFDALIAMGGDGTNCQLLNGVLKYHPDQPIPPLGIIPVGRGNSFAKDLDIVSTADGIAAIAKQNTLEVDVCRFTQGKASFYFVNLMGFGFVTDVARTAARFGWAGDLSYVIGVFHRTVGLQFHRLELEIDGTLFRGRNCFVEFCNSRYTGGNMLMAPQARIDDGYFDAVILSSLSRMNLLTTFPKIFKGTHFTNPRVQVFRGKRAVVRTDPRKVLLPDGEIFGSTPTTIEVLPRRVKYLYRASSGSKPDSSQSSMRYCEC